ncbi:MAG: Glu-tRNA(Gln) amidotransferase subunit GatE [Candidatus Krumholzibacteriota bacterium]|nr:Glu-tRNA(Gln) amidotransferase subunit GatE [Candidatus Krumholzibacteriota bacterium]
MTEIKTLDETTDEDYSKLGLKSGLEIHQQLSTEKKLFCRCPVVDSYTDEYNAEILRHMRPTLSELGEYDGTALMEFKTKKEIIYQIDDKTVCTYEMDDTPPFELNEQALDIALEITMLLNCKLVSEIHIARKQYLDGSIPTGFQRTTILGVDGSIPYKGRKIGIIQLGLEEDACREISDSGHKRIYRADRLGIPLVESVTMPDMKTPGEVADIAQILRWLVRSTGKVRRGIGSARQDVNVSIKGGKRVEIKGVPKIPAIPLLVHNEAFRQRSLLDIADELKRRNITRESFRSENKRITDIVKNTRYYPAAESLRKNGEVRAVLLKGYRGILSRKTQPETSFSKEISDRVRVIACLDILPNIAHSDMEGETFSSLEWTKTKKKLGSGENDAVVVVWGNKTDVETAAEEIKIRAIEAITGVPNETRQALPDGTTGFERILPGPNRMYPDTDLPPLAITEERIKRIKSTLPVTPSELQENYKKAGLTSETAERMSISPRKDLFNSALGETSFDNKALAFFILERLGSLLKSKKIPNIGGDIFLSTLKKMEQNKVPFEFLTILLEKTCASNPVSPDEAIRSISFLEGKSTESEIKKSLKSVKIPNIGKEKLRNYLMGKVMEDFNCRVTGKKASEIVDNFISTLKE